jgi:hypothetical protein
VVESPPAPALVQVCKSSRHQGRARLAAFDMCAVLSQLISTWQVFIDLPVLITHWHNRRRDLPRVIAYQVDSAESHLTRVIQLSN